MSKKKKMLYVPGRVNAMISVQLFGQTVTLPVTTLADGCEGCMLVFRTKTAALKWGGDADLIEIEEGKNE